MARSLLLAALFLACLSLPFASAKDEMECQSLGDAYLTKHHKEASPFTGQNMVSDEIGLQI